jgi:hypothetical protein
VLGLRASPTPVRAVIALGRGCVKALRRIRGQRWLIAWWKPGWPGGRNPTRGSKRPREHLFCESPEDRARADGTGLWGDKSPVAPWEWRKRPPR